MHFLSAIQNKKRLVSLRPSSYKSSSSRPLLRPLERTSNVRTRRCDTHCRVHDVRFIVCCCCAFSEHQKTNEARRFKLREARSISWAVASSLGEWSVDVGDGASISIKQAIRTNKKSTLKGDLGERFPAMRDWPSDKISLPEFVWRFCMGSDVPEGYAVSSRNKIPGDVREANLNLVKKTGDRVPRVVVCPPPPGLDVPHGLLPLDLSVAYRPAKKELNSYLLHYTISNLKQELPTEL